MSLVQVKVGDLFASEAEALVNTVNCVGVMGKGIALEFKRRFPEMFADYVKRCEQSKVRLGEPYAYRALTGPVVVNFPTKDNWRGVSKLDAIVKGLVRLESLVREENIQSLAVPPLGCGNGQLEWNVVGPTLFRHLAKLQIPVELYAPAGTPPEQLTERYLGGLFAPEDPAQMPAVDATYVSPAWVALIEVVNRILAQPYRPTYGRVFFQKTAYFLTQAGVPTELTFERNSYGPYAEDLKGAIGRLQANGLVRERPQAKAILIEPGDTFKDAKRAYKDVLQGWDEKIDRVADLMLRMTSSDAEIAASVHFAASTLSRSNDKVSEIDVLHYVQEWKSRRKPPLQEVAIAESIRSLNLLGWIKVDYSSELPVNQDGLLRE